MLTDSPEQQYVNPQHCLTEPVRLYMRDEVSTTSCGFFCYRTTLMQGYDCCARRSSILRVVMRKYLPEQRTAPFGISSMNDQNLFHE
jgi:hypothetical protein